MPEYDYLYPKESVEKLREQLLDFVKLDDKELYDEQDVEEVEINDWWIRRYLIHFGGDEKAALHGLMNCLKWRKQVNLRSLRDNHFPEEMYRIGALFRYEKDQNGVPVLFIRLKMVKKLTVITDLIKLFIAYQFNTIDTESKGNGWGLVIDFDGAGLQNADMDLAKFIVFSLKCYFPSALSYVFCVDFPWILKAFWNVIKAWLPSELNFDLKFIHRKHLVEYINPENLPEFIGGKCKKPLNTVPTGCPKFIDYCVKEMNIPQRAAEKIFAVYRPFLNESTY